jgi:signal transduction histidine kinase/CheY-like chemotaxis protein
MQVAVAPPNEASRLAALRQLGILGSPPDPEFDALARAASLVCGTPISLVSLVEEDSQWFKANHGLDGVAGTSRDVAFCSHAILGDEVMEVPDATQDDRFADNPLVQGEPNIRFYAGAPLRLSDGSAVGTLCVIDRAPRQLSEQQRELLRCLAAAAASALDSWRARRIEAQFALELHDREERARQHIAELKRRDDALRKSQEFLDRTGSIAGIGGWELDLATGELQWTSETYRIHGVPPDYKPVLETVIEFYPPEARAVIHAALAEAIATGKSWDHELPFVSAQGREMWVRAVGSVAFVDGKPVRITGAFQDITDRHQMQANLHHSQKMSALGRLASGVAHDFNNILQTIGGGLEIVLDELTPGTQAHQMAEVGLQCTRRGSHLTHQLLSYARKQFLRPRPINLTTYLSDISDLLGRTLGPRIAIIREVGDDVPDILADPFQLETALLNLAINASQAMPEGGRLVIEAGTIAELTGRWVSLTLTDTGIGMDAATLAQAIEPFFTTKGHDGTGLGLSMVQGFAEQSGGHLRIASTPGQGTRVELLLPPAPRPAAENRPAAATATLGAGRCILLVDDEPDVLVTTGAFLELAGFKVLRDKSGDDALARLAGGAAVAAIVTDHAMPGLNGADLIVQARLARPGLPAILISGFVELTTTKALPPGVGTLHKPFQRQELINALQLVLASPTGGPDAAITAGSVRPG